MQAICRKEREFKNQKKATSLKIGIHLEARTKGIFSKINNKLKKSVATGLLALTTLFGGLTYSGNAFSASPKENYFTNLYMVADGNGFNNVIKVVHDDNQHINDYDGTVILELYNTDGSLKASKDVGPIQHNGGLTLDLKELFPDIDQSTIGKIAIRSKTQVEAAIIYDGGNNAASVGAVKEGQSRVIAQHFAEQLPQWRTDLLIAKTDNRDSNVYLQLQNSGLEINLSDYFNINPGDSGVNINIGQFLVDNGFASEDSLDNTNNWGVLLSQNRSETAFGTSVENIETLVTATVFKALDRPRAGAFGASKKAYDWWLPHIVTNVYWWTGVVVNNDNDEEATVRIKTFDNSGNLLDVLEYKIPPHTKLVDTASNLGFNEKTSIAEVESDELVGVAYLYGGRKNLGNILVGIDAIPIDNITTIEKVDNNTYDKRLQGVLPIVESRDWNPKTNNKDWTGIGILNDSDKQRTYALELVNEVGQVLAGGEVLITVNPMSKYVITIEDLVKQLDSERNIDIDRRQIDHIKIYSQPKDNFSQEANMPIKAFGVVGDINDEGHNKAYGENFVETDTITAVVQIYNATRGKFVDSIDGEVNDDYKIFVTVKDRIGGIRSAGLLAYDADGSYLIDLAGVTFDPGKEKPSITIITDYVVGWNDGLTNKDITLKLDLLTVEQGAEWTYVIGTRLKPHISQEQDYDIDQIKGEGYSYEVSKSNLEELASLISSEDVIYMDGKQYDYDENIPYLQNLFDGDTSNFEASYVEIIDTHGGFEDSTAGMLKIWRTDGHPEWFSTSSEKTVEKWKKFYGVGIYNNDSNNK